MAARKKNTVDTPLHLLQQLSGSLLDHLEEACAQAHVDAEKLLAKLEKQRGKAQEKLHESRLQLEEAAANGKVKLQAKARKHIDELEELLDTLKQRQTETRSYIAQLKADAETSLTLAQGIGKVKAAVGQALAQREGAPADKPVAAARTRSTTTAPAAKKPAAAKPAAAKPAAAKPTAAKPTAPRKPAAKAVAKPANA